MPAVALTDQSNLFGLVKFFRKAFAHGVKPVIGVDVRVFNDDEEDRPFGMVLLCRNLDGYRNLTRLVSRSYLEGQIRGTPMVRQDWLDKESANGLIALSGGPNGDVGRAIVAGHRELADKRIAHWLGMFGDCYYLELTRTGRPDDEKCLQASLQLAAEHAVPRPRGP